MPLEKLHDHPANPDPAEAEIVQMMDWLSARGQDEAITVRPVGTWDVTLPIGHYQVLAGKTRLAAARRLGWETLDARIRTDLPTEPAAIAFIAASNAQRRTEHPIRQAQMLQAMFAAGLTLKQAGQVYGITSQGGVRNKLQLLKLPEVWQQRIISGEVPETAARCLVPYAETSLLETIDAVYRKDKQNPWTAENWQGREQFERAVQDIVYEHVRPLEGKQNYGYQLGGEHPRYFELTPEVEAKLQIAELPIGLNGAKVRVATNAKAFDAFQVPLIQERLKAKKNGKSAAKSKSKASKKSDAEDEKRKRAEQADQVAKRVADWRQRFLRLAIAETIRPGDYRTAFLLPVLCHAAGQNTTNYQRAPLNDFLAAAVAHNTCDSARRRQPPELAPDLRDADLVQVLGRHLDASDDPVDEIEHVHYGMVRYLLWPQCAGPSADPPAEHVLSAGPPDVLPPIDHHTVEAIAAYVGADLKSHWQRGAIHGSYERPLVEEFFGLHFRWQLDQLSEELLGSPLEAKHGKTAAIQVLMAHHSGKHLLKLPKCIAAAVPKPKKAKHK